MSACTCFGPGAISNKNCSIHGEGAQPLPTASSHPVAHRMVQDDLEARLQLGISRYGQPLQPFNGRNSLRDAYEEMLDLCVYLRNALYEQEHDANRANLGLATTRELLTEIEVRMRITQNSTNGDELGRLCREALAHLDPWVLNYSTMGGPSGAH